jgi:hypothetical protein
LLTTESTDRIVESIHFLVEFHTNIPNLSDELIHNFLSPVIAVSQAREIETEESKDISILLRFADIEESEYYITTIPEDPIRYLPLLAHITDLLPLDMLSLVIMAASAAILASGNCEQKFLAKRFCKPCLAARGASQREPCSLRSVPVTWLVI